MIINSRSHLTTCRILTDFSYTFPSCNLGNSTSICSLSYSARHRVSIPQTNNEIQDVPAQCALHRKSLIVTVTRSMAVCILSPFRLEDRISNRFARKTIPFISVFHRRSSCRSRPFLC